MKNFFILIFTLFFMFSCSSIPVEEVSSQQSTTVDLTSNNSAAVSEDEVADSFMDNVDNIVIGDPYTIIYFDYDSDSLKEENLSVLLDISRQMKDNQSYTLLVEAHADERGYLLLEFHHLISKLLDMVKKDLLMMPLMKMHGQKTEELSYFLLNSEISINCHISLANFLCRK